WFDAQPRYEFRRRRRDLGQGRGVGLDVHGRVGEEEGLLAEDHHVDAADVLAAGLHADDLERRAKRVGIVDFLAGYERVGATRSQQQQAVVNRVQDALLRFARSEEHTSE